MKRRSNKSHRVPNVKLRPGEPQPSSSLLAADSTFWPEDSQLRSDDTAVKDSCPRPFKNVILCATGIPDKPALFKKALELGAGAISAFTDKVTHLIAVSHGGAKYKCALEHNVPIVRPSWIEDNYEIWLHGDDVESDLEQSVEPHRLPVFSEVVVCVSGIPELERRADIRRIVEQQGGAYVKAIERPVKVTHLLCSGDEETDKMRYAEKFTKRGEAEIHIVWEDWFWDSLKVKGRLEEHRYNVRNPRPAPMVLRTTQPNVPDSTSTSRANSMSVPERPAPADEMEDEAARINIVPDITLKVWTGLLERRGYEVADGEVVRSPSKSQNRPRSITPPDRRRGSKPTKHNGVISAVRSINTFESVEKGATSNPSQRPLPFKRGSTSNSNRSDQSRSGDSTPTVEANEAGPSNLGQRSEDPQTPQIFWGMQFRVLGEANTHAVRTAIEEGGGKVVSEESDAGESVDIYLVRLISGSSIYRSETDVNVQVKYRTECWLERCIHEERICEIDEHVSFVPLAVDLPIPGANAIQIGLSGLDQSESCHTRRLLKAFGINLIPLFSKKATHLLCPSGVGLKYDKAREWGIPVVSNDWLAAIASTGTIPMADEHLIASLSLKDAPQKHAIPGDAKGKGRATEGAKQSVTTHDKVKGKMRERSISNPPGHDMEVDDHMNDITNNHPPDPPEPPPAPVKIPAHPQPLGKAGSLERHPTSIIPEGQPAPKGFGQPTEMLGSITSTTASSSFYAHPSSIQPLKSQGTPLVKYGTNPKSHSIAHSMEESVLPRGSISRPNISRKLTNRSTLSRKSSTASLRSDDAPYIIPTQSDNDNDHDMCVPSSKSPSPMKAPRRHGSLSPAKLDLGAAKALQESIASLLGKRQQPEDEEDADSLPVVECAGEAANAKAEGRAKRRRPQRAKPSTRKPRTRKSPSPAAPDGGVGVSLSAFDTYGAGAAADEPSLRLEEPSVRVVYEDPAQLQERQRLMSLLKKTPSSNGNEEESMGTTLSGSSVKTGSIGSRVTRRSGRIPGASNS